MTAHDESSSTTHEKTEKADVFLLTVASLASDVESLRHASIWNELPPKSCSAKQLDGVVTALETKMDILTAIVANELDTLDKSLLEGKDTLDQGHALVQLWDSYKAKLEQSGSMDTTPSVLSSPPTTPPSVKEDDNDKSNGHSNDNNIQHTPSRPRSSPSSSSSTAAGSSNGVHNTPTSRLRSSPSSSSAVAFPAVSTPQRTTRNNRHQEPVASPVSVGSSGADSNQQQDSTGIHLKRVTEDDLARLTRAERSRLTVSAINDALTEIEQVFRQKHKKAARQIELLEATGQTALYQSPLTVKRRQSKRDAITASLACKEEEFSETCDFFKKAPRSARAIMNILMVTKRLERVKGTHSVDIHYKICLHD